jgi:heme/copper-type cytochrome/quinol oxidase subunit 3
LEKTHKGGFLCARSRASIALGRIIGHDWRIAMRPKGDRNADDSISFSLPSVSHNSSESQFALRLFGMAAGLLAVAAGLAVLLTRTCLPPRSTSGTFVVPVAFAFSTALLILCSVALGRALSFVRRERQRAFRRSLLWAVVCGTGFVGIQTFGLWGIVQNLAADRNAGEAQLGATASVLGAAALHAVHVCVALMVLSYVTLRALRDRYDHEYSFGVAFCTWFWHILGILWVFILGTYGIVSWFLALCVP